MRISFILKTVAAIFISMTLFLVWAAQTHTPQFKDVSGRFIEGSIASERYVMLGGEAQYVLVRGENKTAPILLFLHGGPGTSAMAFNRIHNAELERSFVFVNWDQRGAGKSIKAAHDPSTITLDRMVSDLDELVDLLRTEFNQNQVLLVGHSWGSTLGLAYIDKHPEKVSAYIGIGQMADTAASETEMYQWVMEQAQTRDDAKAIATLQEIGAPPYASIDEMMTQRALVNKYGGAWVKPKSDIAYAMDVIRAPEFSWTELTTILKGGSLSMEALFSTFTELKAIKDYPVLEVPIFFFEGRGDKVVSPQQAIMYYEAVKAPLKDIVWFEGSAHSPQWEEPEKFNAAILDAANRVGLLEDITQ